MVYSKSKLLLTCLLVVLTMTLASPVFAVSPSAINVDVAPPNPAPGDNVTITLSSYAANLDTVSISWLVNGKNASSGIGQKTFSMTAGSAGSSITVVAEIALPDGEIDKSIIIRPAVMVMLWKATDSYVPPFYKGKALLSQEGDVKVVAIPEIRTTSGVADPRSMTYAWQKDYENAADQGGYGKDFFTFTNDYLDNSNNIAVTATTVDQNYSSQGNIDVGVSPPAISFYREDPNLGIVWEKAVQDGDKVQSGETIMAAPYFISPKDLWRPELTFSWFINDLVVSINSDASDPYSKNLMPLQVQAGTSGTSSLKVQVDNTQKLTDTVTRQINVQF